MVRLQTIAKAAGTNESKLVLVLVMLNSFGASFGNFEMPRIDVTYYRLKII